MQPGACFLVNKGIKLKDPQRLTIYGGMFRDDAATPGPRANSKGHPVFTLLGGSQVTLESMQISGVNPGGYHAAMAFASGIWLDGTSRATIRSVAITRTFGDGITLAPLRGGSDHNSGTIIAPTSAVTIRDVTIEGAGRQGIAFASVKGAQVSDVVVNDTGLDTFDVEADQWDEGASHVTIDGCTASGGALFFANGGEGVDGTKDIEVEHCTMSKPEGGSAVLVVRSRHSNKVRGPFSFVADSLWCGSSVYVACVQLSGADVTVSDSTLRFPGGTAHEPVYHLSGRSTAQFSDDVVKGYAQKGRVSVRSSVHVSEGQWIKSGHPANKK
jgi:hypothetical protein